MQASEAVIVDDPSSEELRTARLPDVYDREIGVRLVYLDPSSGAEHYLIRYPGGLRAQPHRHSAAHTIVVLEGRLAVSDRIVGPGAYCHFPAGVPMIHQPAGDEDCLMYFIFDGPQDVEALGDASPSGARSVTEVRTQRSG